MTTTTIVRSRSAIGVGVFFTAVTGYVLLSDVLQHGAPFTTKHLMTLAVLAGTVYFGHALWRELRAWRFGTAFGCVVLFLAGTATCVLMSAGRNAEVVTSKVLAANSVNTARNDARKDRDEAKARYLAALKAEEAECGSGQGEKCWGKRTTTKLRREDFDAAEKTLREQKAEQIANADVRAAADLISRLPFVAADVDAVEALLLLAFPFLQSLFCEIGAVVGFSIGLGHAVVGLRQLPPPLPKFPPMKTVSRVSPEAESVLSALKGADHPLTNDELAAKIGISKGEASKRVTELNGAVQRIRDPGNRRHVLISLAEQRLH